MKQDKYLPATANETHSSGLHTDPQKADKQKQIAQSSFCYITI